MTRMFIYHDGLYHYLPLLLLSLASLAVTKTSLQIAEAGNHSNLKERQPGCCKTKAIGWVATLTWW